jgi:hypothetical protein
MSVAKFTYRRLADGAACVLRERAETPNEATTDSGEGIVARRVKDFIEISDYTSLDSLIRFLETVRDTLPEGAEPELKLRGDDVFGRRLTISYFRELTEEESEREQRYSANDLPSSDPSIEELRRQLDDLPYRAAKQGDG